MKAKKAWVRFNAEYNEWQFSPTRPDYSYNWTEIIYFEVEQDD